MRDTTSTTVEAAAAWAREDAAPDRPTLGELAGDDFDTCPVWDDAGEDE